MFIEWGGGGIGGDVALTNSAASSRADRPRRREVARLLRALDDAFGRPLQPRRRPAPLAVLVGTILSQHTSDTNSTRAYVELRRRFPRWEGAARARSTAIARAIRAGGLARQKSVVIADVLRSLRGDYSLRGLRRMDDDAALDSLQAFRGVGLKTAACVLLFSLGRNVCPVDVHVHRVLTRVGIPANGRSPEETFHSLRPLIPRGHAYSLHMNLIRLGRTVCRPTDPGCDRCPIVGLCRYASQDAGGRAA